jgi:hypothetical protein
MSRREFDVSAVAAELDRRFSRPDELQSRRRDAHGRFAPAVPSARDHDQPTGIRATLHRHFAWDLDEPLPLFLEALAAVEGRAS